MAKPEPVTFIVPGQDRSQTARTRGAAPPPVPLPIELSQGTLKQSVSVGVGRGAGGVVSVEAVPGEDVVVFQIANGPTLMLHPETARDLMLAQGQVGPGRGAGDLNQPAENEVTVATQLRWQGLEDPAVSRGGPSGLLGRVLLSAMHVITGIGPKLVASKLVEKVDGQVEPGLYRLSAEALPPLKGSGAPAGVDSYNGGPLLVLIHGTFSSTSGTFGKLWTAHPELVRSLFSRYKEQVYGLDHPTLGQSPIANAITLAESLPRGARLHLVTHSRGGLVAEVLARLSADAELSGKELAFFAGDGYDTERKELTRLAGLLKQNEIKVERVVRVACPARGTLLASKRLDAYISVFKWTLELAGIPVAPALVEFLAQVARQRTDPAVLPGLAAQIPDNPLIQWLHAVDNPLGGELRVVAGDGEGDSITSWLKTLMSDAFYWTDNDLVVQTRSMYGGGPRTGGATFLLDRGAKVSHFTYFSNPRTAEAIVDALIRDEEPQGFSTIGPLSWAGESATGSRAANRARASTVPPSEKPAVFLLPGILGSNLKVNDRRIWLHWRLINGLMRLAYKPPGPDGVEPDGALDNKYDRLGDFLSRSHEVIEFGFDWRKPIEQVAQLLADSVEEALETRAASGQPVRLLAHSMGGVVARTMQLERPEVWERMMSRPGARVLMLGTPNGGSWAPMQVLSGDDTFGNLLAFFGAPFRDWAARDLMARFPGFIQLQAGLLDPTLKLRDSDTWRHLADEDVRLLSERSWWHNLDLQLGAYAWGVPPQEVLDQAVALRERLDAQLDNGFGAFSDRIVMVAGKARFTPDGFETGRDGLVYLDAQEDGDGRVTLRNVQLPGVRLWQLDCEHGSLPEKREAFEAYQELLETGTTTGLKRLMPALRGAAARPVSHVRSRPSRTRTKSRPPASPSELLASPGAEPPSERPDEIPLRITVHNGDLSFVREPLLLGHYRSTRLTGTERVMDDLIGHLMQDALTVGSYPDPPGTYKVFPNAQAPRDNPWQLPRPQAVIVVGLGPEGKLRASELVQTVTEGVVAWAEQESRKPAGAPVLFELAATLIGSGGTGIGVGQSARLIAQGVRDANRRLAKANWPRVGHLHLIELYLDRATEAWRALRIQMETAPANYSVTEIVQVSKSGLRRPLDLGYRGADYDFLSAITPENGADGVIQYTLDTRRARSEVRAQITQSKLIRAMVKRASNDRNSDPQIGNTLCRLLLPLEMDPFIGGASELVIELDSHTAGIPWEIFDADTPGGGESMPWAVRSKLLRKLRTEDFRQEVRDADLESSALVIGEPLSDRRIYPELPGAREEANAVAKRLMALSALGPERVKALVSSDDPPAPGPDAQTVMNALLDKDRSWRIIHIAGHGDLPSEETADQKYGGVVLSNGTFIGPREIRSMRVVPELVFVNCCHLAAFTPDQLLDSDQRRPGGPYDRTLFASNVAEELIKIGVRCVVAAGWAVDDDPARLFAETFYDALLRGESFIDAVAVAREAAWREGGNTWAAYQCYGDPDWKLRPRGGDPQNPAPDTGSKRPELAMPLAQEFAGVASAQGLILALETIAAGSRFQRKPPELQQMKIRYLDDRFGQRWAGAGNVAEAFGVAWNEAEDKAKAIKWLRRAVAANDGSASIRAIEQLGNVLVRHAEETLTATRDRPEEPKKKAPKAKGRAKAKAAPIEVELPAAQAEAKEDLQEGLELLEKVLDLEETMERQSLCGSAYKRRAIVAVAEGLRGEEEQAIAKVQEHYLRAEEIGRQRKLGDVFYPRLNLLAAELALHWGQKGWQGLDAEAKAATRTSLEDAALKDPDFWSVVGLVELRMYEAVEAGNLADARASIEAAYDDAHRRVSATWYWRSVHDQARFVLSGYAARAPEKERSAAKALHKRLEMFATGKSSLEKSRSMLP